MGHEITQSQPLGALHLDDESLDGTPIENLVGGREVDEIGVMRHRMAEFALPQRLAKERDIPFGQLLALPLVGVLGEELDRSTIPGGRGDDGVVIAAGHGHMGAEQRHGKKPSISREPACCQFI